MLDTNLRVAIATNIKRDKKQIKNKVLNGDAMNNINKTIKHFESLQKRYTTQHNGQMCERVADALEALYRFQSQEDFFKKCLELLKIQGNKNRVLSR